MTHPHFPNTQMVVKVNPILKTWWEDIQKSRVRSKWTVRQPHCFEPFCTHEYYVWLLEDTEHRDLSEGGLPGIGDEKERRWARNFLNTDYDITLEMKKQIVPNIGEQHD